MSSKRAIASEGNDERPSKRSTALFIPENFNIKRTRLITTSNTNVFTEGKCVVYWMSRDQRVIDNHAIQYAQSIAVNMGVPLTVVFNLVPKFLEATVRQYGFMIKGLEEVESQLRSRNIPFYLLFGNPVENIPRFVEEYRACALISDFSPMRVGLGWVSAVANSLDASTQVPLFQVDAHNIVR